MMYKKDTLSAIALHAKRACTAQQMRRINTKPYMACKHLRNTNLYSVYLRWVVQQRDNTLCCGANSRRTRWPSALCNDLVVHVVIGPSKNRCAAGETADHQVRILETEPCTQRSCSRRNKNGRAISSDERKKRSRQSE